MPNQRSQTALILLLILILLLVIWLIYYWFLRSQGISSNQGKYAPPGVAYKVASTAILYHSDIPAGKRLIS
jgi:flagellar basal body-associated protein FliL